MPDPRAEANKRWRENNPEQWRRINRRNQEQWKKERYVPLMLEKHEQAMAHDPEALSTDFLKKRILRKYKPVEVLK